MISEDSFQQLLTAADDSAAKPPALNADAVITAVLHKQSRQKSRRIFLSGCSSVAAALLIVGLVWLHHDRNKQFEIARLQNEIQTLNQRLDTTMAMVQKTLEMQRRQEKLTQLENQLAQYGDFDRKLQAQEEDTALTILIQADRLREANLLKDAQAFYGRVIDMYPKTYWAQIARQKLQRNNKNENLRKGDTL
jgi:hypothetical protein